MPEHNHDLPSWPHQYDQRSISPEDKTSMLTAMVLVVAGSILEVTVNTAAAAVLLVLITPIGVAAEPRVLGDLELDGVTAAGVFVDVNSVAAAFGNRTLTLTDSNTVAVAGKWFDLGLGLTLGRAFACCGEAADVEVASTVVGVGDIVHRGTRAFKRDDGNSARGLSAGYVVAVSFKELPPSHKLRPGPPR